MMKKILIDMDDVLCDCTGDALLHMGWCDFKREDFPIEERNIYEAYRLKTGISHTPKSFWTHFPREWWANIQTTSWCYDLIDLAVSYVGEDNVALLTSPTKCGDCLAGKLDWIEKFMPTFLHRQYLMSPRKGFCGAGGNILIDDCTENLIDFKKNGGEGILLPQKWNIARHYIGRELEHVENNLDRYQSTWAIYGYGNI
jgi:5'(3')-deoxyribonucleotidase